MRYLDFHITRRFIDNVYELNMVLCAMDLDTITLEQAEASILEHYPWQNQLRWVTVAVNREREPLVVLATHIMRRGSVFTVLHNNGIRLSSTDWRMDGASGRITALNSIMALGSSLSKMAQSGKSTTEGAMELKHT